jgi:hypothetical protein
MKVEDYQIGLALLRLQVTQIARCGVAVAAYIHLKGDTVGTKRLLDQNYVREMVVGHHNPDNSGCSVFE